MQISSYQWNSQVSGITAINNQQMLFRNSQYSEETTTTIGEDTLSISSQGKHMAMRMQRMREMDPADIEDRMTQMKSAVEDLNLDNLDLENMSQEELQTVATEIHETMSAFRPEGAPEISVDFTSFSEDELENMITGFSNHMTSMENGLGQMMDVAGGGMPPMGGMSGGGRGGMQGMGGRPPMAGMQSMGGTDETEESEETDLIDTLLEALQSEDEDEEENSFLQAIYAYMDAQGYML